ncbi:MAG TPA: LLM class flavin-dependent oxidoreductase [Candidatus Binatia bacterium]|nr:LLM class flavin-dependent oxidoreductase [Candidatus Binatia bacterium]
MGRVSVGYQDGGIYPLWLSRLNIRLAKLFGASAVWLPDHFMGFTPRQVWKPELTPAAKLVHSLDGLFDPLQILAVTATRVRGIDLGTSVTESIRRHPMSLAQSFVTLDHLSKGRAVLGIGSGIRENTEPYGLPYRRTVARLEEALIIIRMLWASGGKPVNYDGKFWKLRDAVFDLPLYKNRPPRLFVAAHFPGMLRLTGCYGDGWLPGQKVTADEYRARLDVIRHAAEEVGRSLGGFLATHTMLVALGDSRERTLDLAMKSRFCAALALGAPADVWRAHAMTHPLGDDHRGFLDLVPPRVTDAAIDQAAATMTPELLQTLMYAGSPTQIRDEVAPLVGAGCRHFIVANMGATFTGDGVKGLWRLRQLMRELRRL